MKKNVISFIFQKISSTLTSLRRICAKNSLFFPTISKERAILLFLHATLSYIYVPINISVRPWVEEVTLRNNRSVRKAERSRLVQEANMIVKKPSFKSLIIAALWNVTLSLMSTFPWQWCKIMKHSYTFYQLQYQILPQKIAIIKKKKNRMGRLERHPSIFPQIPLKYRRLEDLPWYHSVFQVAKAKKPVRIKLSPVFLIKPNFNTTAN